MVNFALPKLHTGDLGCGLFRACVDASAREHLGRYGCGLNSRRMPQQSRSWQLLQEWWAVQIRRRTG